MMIKRWACPPSAGDQSVSTARSQSTTTHPLQRTEEGASLPGTYPPNGRTMAESVLWRRDSKHLQRDDVRSLRAISAHGLVDRLCPEAMRAATRPVVFGLCWATCSTHVGGFGCHSGALTVCDAADSVADHADQGKPRSASSPRCRVDPVPIRRCRDFDGGVDRTELMGGEVVLFP